MKQTVPKIWLLVLALAVLLVSCAPSPPKAQKFVVAPKESAPSGAVAADPAKRQEYRIGPNDLLQIDVFEVKDLSKEVRVNSAGEISMPLIGLVSVQNLAVHQIESLLKAKLGERYLQNPQVVVTVKEYTNQRVTVEGLVKKPGVYSFKGDATLLHVLALSQGEMELADTGQVRLFRDNGKGERDSYFVDVDAIRKGELEDPVLKGNDIIVVQEHAGKSIWKSFKTIINRFIGIGMSIPLI
jgi:polysaccharide export outer membrane protein